MALLSWLLILTPPSYAQESPAFDKIRDVSPDGKFALRISYTRKPEDHPNEFESTLITAVELVSLPSNKVVMKMGQDDGDSAPDLIWSKDSGWFAFPVSEGHRITYTHVYHRSGDDFSRFETEDPEQLRAHIKGDVRNEYVTPLHWVKPGVLLLQQFVIFRGGEGKDATYQFTAKFDDKSGKFRIISKKRVPSKE